MSKFIEIVGVQAFKQEVTQSEIPTLVDFWAPWCQPCRMLQPRLESVSKFYEGRLKFVKINIDASDNENLASQYGIRSIPTLILFKKNDEIDRKTQLVSESELNEWLQSHLMD